MHSDVVLLVGFYKVLIVTTLHCHWNDAQTSLPCGTSSANPRAVRGVSFSLLVAISFEERPMLHMVTSSHLGLSCRVFSFCHLIFTPSNGSHISIHKPHNVCSYLILSQAMLKHITAPCPNDCPIFTELPCNILQLGTPHTGNSRS